MSRNYTGLGRYEHLFDQMDAAISRLESRCDKIERRVTNLHTSKATYTQQPYACSDSGRKLRTRPLPEPPPQPAQDLQYYSLPCWDPPGHQQQFGRAAYEPLPARPMSHVHSNSSRYSARQNAYRPPRNDFPSEDQFVEQERPLRQPHCARQSPNSGWFSPESHQQQFLDAKRQTCWVPPSQTSGRRVGDNRTSPLPDPPPQPTPPDLLCQQPQHRNQPPTFPSSRTPTRPQLVFDQKPPLQSDRRLKQPSTTSTIELPPYAAPSPCLPLLSLSVKAPLCVSPRQPQAGVSRRKNEWEIDSHNGEEKREDKLVVPTSLWSQREREKEKENDYMAKREEGVNNTFLKLLEKENTVEALRSSLATKENNFIVLTKKPSTRESMEIQNIVDDNKAGFDVKKQDTQVELEEKRRLFDDVLKLKAEELGKTGDAHTGSQALACIYMDLNVSDVTSMIHRPTSLDTDARLIPPLNNKSCLRIQGCVAELSILALNLDDHISPPLLIFYGGDEGRRSAVRCVFDPGGHASPKLLLSTLFVASWFPP